MARVRRNTKRRIHEEILDLDRVKGGLACFVNQGVHHDIISVPAGGIHQVVDDDISIFAISTFLNHLFPIQHFVHLPSQIRDVRRHNYLRVVGMVKVRWSKEHGGDRMAALQQFFHQVAHLQEVSG